MNTGGFSADMAWNGMSAMCGIDVPDATPVGLNACGMRRPRVARAAQPWTAGRNPVGISNNLLRQCDMVAAMDGPVPPRSRCAIIAFLPPYFIHGGPRHLKRCRKARERTI
jgi:hypothetical protein